MAFHKNTQSELQKNLTQIANDYLDGWITLTECYMKTIDDTHKWYREMLGANCHNSVTDDALAYVNHILMGGEPDTWQDAQKETATEE